MKTETITETITTYTSDETVGRDKGGLSVSIRHVNGKSRQVEVSMFVGQIRTKLLSLDNLEEARVLRDLLNEVILEA